MLVVTICSSVYWYDIFC